MSRALRARSRERRNAACRAAMCVERVARVRFIEARRLNEIAETDPLTSLCTAPGSEIARDVSIGLAAANPQAGRSLERPIQKAHEAPITPSTPAAIARCIENLAPADSDTGQFKVARLQ